MRLPPALTEHWQEEKEWLASLPELAVACAAEWSLTLEEPVNTPHSLVVPAGDTVLKLNAPSHFEADHEADALVTWRGCGAVRLLERDDDRRALLMERCRPGTPLAEADVDQVAVAPELLSRLSSDPGPAHPYRLLADEADRWAEELPRQRLDARLLAYALDVFGSVDRDAAFLVNQDLHGWNVLAAERESWLVIDPKPLVGERELDGVGLLRNAETIGEVRRWCAALADLGLDRERLRGWGVAHALAWDNLEAAERIRAA